MESLTGDKKHIYDLARSHFLQRKMMVMVEKMI